MSSHRKTESSRANGARSHGPVTAEGKQRSSQNALRHGLLAGQVLLEGESREAFEENLTDLVQRFQPADEVAYSFIEEMAVCHWRIRRTWAIEAHMLQKQVDLTDLQPGDDGIGCLTDAFETYAASPALAVIHRYETRLHRMYRRALKNLLLLRTLELPKEPNPISEHSTAAGLSSAAGLADGVLSPEHPDPTPGLRSPTPGPRPPSARLTSMSAGPHRPPAPWRPIH